MIEISRATRLFFDASVLIAGAKSPGGGSALLLEACRVGGFQAVVSQGVLIEVVRNLHDDLAAWDRIRDFRVGISWEVTRTPNEEHAALYSLVIHPKDAHVLAAAVDARCTFLLTLDRRHFLTESLRRADLPLIILSPGDFIRDYYPLHPDYPSLLPARNA